MLWLQSGFGLTENFFRLSELVLKPSHRKNLAEVKFPAAHRRVAFQSKDGPVLVAEVVAGPFDLHRKYRSMEGPFVNWTCNIASLIGSEKIYLPASRVDYTEASGPNSMTGQAVAGFPNRKGNTSVPQAQAASPVLKAKSAQQKISGMIRLRGRPRQLYWFKGIDLQVLDEHDKPLPTAEFICHFNLDVNDRFRDRVFKTGEPCRNSRLISLTQGQTKFFFPDGYAVPVAGNEPFSLGFQAANRTTTKHRRIKHICRLYFIKDSDAIRPIQALQWDCPFLALVMDNGTFAHNTAVAKKVTSYAVIARTCTPVHSSNHGGDSNVRSCLTGSCCLSDTPQFMPGQPAPNSGGLSIYTQHPGNHSTAPLTGHWVVPCGTSSYRAPYYVSRFDDDFTAYPRTLHAAWCHIHPLCTEASLVECTAVARKKLFTVHIKTRTKPGLEIINIENIYSEKGIPIAGNSAGFRYELEAVYRNTTGRPQDSMVSMGLFAADDKFKRPNWAQ